MTETSGLKPSMSFAEYDHDSCLWRTYQVCLLTLMPDEFTETWPKAGMTVDGVGYLLPKQEHRIAAIDGGALPTPTNSMMTLGDMEQARYAGSDPNRPTYQEANRTWPTPQAHDHHKGDPKRVGRYGTKHGGRNLNDEAAMWPTPSASDWKGSSKAGQRRGQLTDPAMNVIPPGGSLNPMWVEWLMGWPLGWTALEPLEMDKFQQWCEQHGIC